MRNIYKLLCLVLVLAFLTGCGRVNEKMPNFHPDDPLAGILPDSFVLGEVYNKWDDFKSAYAIYDDMGRSVYFSVAPAGGTLMLNTENAEVSQFLLKGYDAVITEIDQQVSLTWIDEELEVYFMLDTLHIEKEQTLAYAEAFIDTLYS